MAEQMMTVETIFTLKIETLLTQKILSVRNTQTSHMDQVYVRLQPKNMKLQNQVQELTRELCRTVATKTALTWTLAMTAHTVSFIPNPRIASEAAKSQTPRQNEQTNTEQQIRSAPQPPPPSSSKTPTQPKTYFLTSNFDTYSH